MTLTEICGNMLAEEWRSSIMIARSHRGVQGRAGCRLGLATRDSDPRPRAPFKFTLDWAQSPARRRSGARSAGIGGSVDESIPGPSPGPLPPALPCLPQLCT